MDNFIEKETLTHLVTFRLGSQIYALPIDPIQQVIEMVAITPIPQVRSSVEGVINFHGTTVPVVSLRELLGMPKIPMTLHTPIIMVKGSEWFVGLMVDEVLSVLDLPLSQLVKPRDILPEGLGKTSLLHGLFHADQGTILVLDTAYLFAPQEATALAEAVAALPMETRPAGKPDDNPKPASQKKTSPKSKKRPAARKTKSQASPVETPE